MSLNSRPRTIYQKMIVRGREFNDIYDLVGVRLRAARGTARQPAVVGLGEFNELCGLVGVRVLVDTVRDCYAALGVIHANWQPVPGRFKDYIAMPKFNMNQSRQTP